MSDIQIQFVSLYRCQIWHSIYAKDGCRIGGLGRNVASEKGGNRWHAIRSVTNQMI